MSDENKPTEVDSKPTEVETKSDPSSSDEGQSQDKTAEAPSKIPEQFKDKSMSDVVKMYGELERKLGEQSQSVNESRKIQDQIKILDSAVAQLSESDPDTINKLKNAINRAAGKDVPIETGKKSDGEANVSDPRIAELRKANENRILSDFYSKYGLDKLNKDEQKQQAEKIMNEFVELTDPGGNKTVAQSITETNLSILPKILEKAYLLANISDSVNRNKSTLDLASIGAMPASSESGDGSNETLSASELETAKKMNVKPEDYLKQKQALSEA